ncbi:MAG TPA: hypothetical protein VGZ25_13175 [Gemmataceae bacterium]|nr:hypothetical protein [Gemmataceae bacterium]
MDGPVQAPHPEKLSTHATLSMEQIQGNWTITAIHLDLSARIPGFGHEKFEETAADSKANYPVSRVLNAKIALEAKLEAT